MDKNGFSHTQSEYVYNWDDSEYRRERKEEEERIIGKNMPAEQFAWQAFLIVCLNLKSKRQKQRKRSLLLEVQVSGTFVPNLRAHPCAIW